MVQLHSSWLRSRLLSQPKAAPMEIETEKKPAMSGGERDEESILPSNGSSSALGDDNRSCEMNLSGKHMREEDADVNEEKLLSSKNEGKLQMQGVDSHFLWKTSLCTYFRKPPGGICRHGDACRFAHGESELRLRPDGSWDPTSERAQKLRKTSDGSSVSGVVEDAEDAAIDLNRLDKFLTGLPKKWASDNVKSFLDEQKISYKLAIKKEGMTVGFVSFEDAEQIKSAIEVLKVNPLNCKQIKIADEVCRSQKKKPETETAMHSSNIEDGSLCDSGDNAAFGTLNAEDVVSKTKSVRDVVTPLAQMSYSDQLEHKKNSLIQTLKRLTRNARKACPKAVPLPEWVLKSREIGGLPCKLEGILESPQVNGYRNKCEFSVGCSIEGKKIVGFMLGNFRDGVTAVEEPESCPNVSRISCNYAKLFEDFIQFSEFPIWNRIDNTGFWRQFTVREGRCPNQMAFSRSLGTEIAEVMLIVQVCSLGHEDDSMRSEFNRMTLALKDGAAACSPPLPLTSIVVQDHTGISNVAPADCPLITLYSSKVDGACDLGVTTITEARIHDYINNLRFSISPTAFFQVNTLAAEKLYSLAGNWAKLSPDTILFDICCGTGTIGLTLAHHVGMVVGIEMNESAVSDANRNAEINCIKNCKFICGKAEVVIGSILEDYLHAPQHYIGSDKSERNGAHIVGNETNEEICEDLKDAAGASADISATNLRTEATLGCLEDSCTDNSVRFTENSTAECVHTTQQNGGESVETDASVHQFNNVVAIVDPPRNGLHPTVIKALRTHPRIRRLVYISCNPETLVANAIELCTPTSEKQEKGKGNRGWRHMSNASLARHRVKSMPTSEPFHPVKAVGVDLFPHTHHCEMVMLLER